MVQSIKMPAIQFIHFIEFSQLYIFSSLYAFIAYRRQWPWLDFFVILASILSLYLIFSVFFNKII